MANVMAGLQFADVLLLDTVELTFTFFPVSDSQTSQAYWTSNEWKLAADGGQIQQSHGHYYKSQIQHELATLQSQ